MSARKPLARSTIVQWLVVIVLAAALVVALSGVRRSAPASNQDFSIPRATGVGDLETTVERCARTLPNQPVLPDTDGVETFGRVSSTAIVECPDIFDRDTITYVGEVVGDVLRREGGAWVLVNDDAYALEVGPAGSSGQLRGQNSGLSVWLPEPLADELDHAGGPGWRGDVIQVVGTLLRVDPDDGGGLTLRASTMAVVSPARRAETPLNRAQLVLALGLAAVVGALVIVERRVAGRR